ncbi:hypothetical protein GALMADRAFT_81643 [Galerina marginata CBS 339.88]|uniref:Tet-like 2OG-Fe(II) oxygenase domain-containing protein n=1 Tax=Galerina marginata (strain CBS 339.88) TaxID=685588 RepID=A0A067SD26_GALM3|nr:hypothetical protein GALMADRAFT_81643 [Galerina marginata CBS 339.88]
MKPNGRMYAAGWRGSFETGVKMAAYAPNRSEEAEAEYKKLIDELPAVAEAFKKGLGSLYPRAFDKLKAASKSFGTPSFGYTTFNGSRSADCFANSLTVTCQDFDNFLHEDNDEIGIAYGWWWAARHNKQQNKYVVDEQCKHHSIRSGAFFWGAYKIAVDFSQCDDLVEIFWRGKEDAHCTMYSESEENMTRFGSSTQLTHQGVLAAQNFWKNNGARNVLLTYKDRLARKRQ